MANAEQTTRKVKDYLERLLLKYKTFTGKVEFNFRDGELMDANETKRTKFEEGK